MGYILQLGTKPQHYTGFRCATPDMEVHDGELYVDSLEGWQWEEAPTPPTPLSVLAELEIWVGTKPVEWLFHWATQITLLRTLFQWWGADNNPLNKAKLLEALEALRAVEGISQQEVDYLVSKVNEVQ
jgi:hypothetical protein